MYLMLIKLKREMKGIRRNSQRREAQQPWQTEKKPQEMTKTKTPKAARKKVAKKQTKESN